MAGEVSTPVWFRHDGDWKNGWGTLSKGQLTIWMHSLMIDPKEFSESLLRRDVRHCRTTSYKDTAAPPSRASVPQRHPRVIELRPIADDSSESQGDDPSKQPISIAACSAIEFAKWSNAIDKFSAGTIKESNADVSRLTQRSRLSPEPEVVALLSCRCPGFLRSFAHARHSLELESTRKLDCNIVMAVTILRSMHSNILDIDISNRPGLPEEQDWEAQVDSLPEIGAMQLATSWLRRMDEYLDGMVQQASAIAESERSEARARAAAMILQDIVYELEGVSRAAQQADAAGVPATFDDGHATADAALASRAAAAAGTETASRRTTAPSASSTASTCSASSAAVNGRSTSNVMALTSALTAPDPDRSGSRSADRKYLNSITQSSGGVKPIMSHSILPYDTHWMHARGV